MTITIYDWYVLFKALYYFLQSFLVPVALTCMVFIAWDQRKIMKMFASATITKTVE